ncbi:MAG: hypothetical protein AB7E79_08615 [Rhodospirillaceae bacterium]
MALQPVSVATDTGHGYVDWCAIAAGAMMATAVSIILFTFGTAIGLSMVSPYEGEGVSRAAYFATLGLWTLWVIVSSFMAGGYLAGRLRRRVGDANEHEVDVRDGAHGLLVWATGVVLASLLLVLGVTGAVGTAVKAGAPAAAEAADNADGGGGMTAYTVDSLFRATTTTAPAQPATDPATGAAMPATPPDDGRADREEVTRIFAHGVTDGELGAEDKAHAASLISRRTGISEAEAQKRIDTALAKAKEAADAARKIGLIVGFLTAAALLVGAAAAAWAAALGGRHRDQNTDTTAFWRWV